MKADRSRNLLSSLTHSSRFRLSSLITHPPPSSFIRRLSSFILFPLLFIAACSYTPGPGTLVIAIEQAPRGFDPRFSTGNSQSARVMQLIYDTLLVKDGQFNFVPSLAERFEVNQDNTAFTFHLRAGVRFHDGRPLTSSDVKYTFDSLVSPELRSPIRALLDKMVAIDTPDALTVVFRAREPFYTFIGNLPAIGIIPQGSGTEIIEAPIGSGPYRFVSYSEGKPIRLERNGDYWGAAPEIPRIDVIVIGDNSTRQAALMNGEVDLAYNAQFDPETNRSLDGRRHLSVVPENGTNIAHLGINMTSAVLSNRKVRQAISYAIDREAIIDSLLLGQARRADSILPPEQWAYEPGVTVYQYEPDLARRLLDEAGFGDPDGDGQEPRLTLSLMTLTTQLSRNIAAVMQEQLRRVGIKLELQSFEFATFFDRLGKAQFDLYYLISVGGNQSTDIFQFVYHSRYHNAEFNDAIAKLRGASSPSEMRPLFNRLAAILQAGTADYCPNREVARLAADAARLGNESEFRQRKQVYLVIAGLLTDRGGANRSRYCNPEVDRLIVEAERAPDVPNKKELYSRIQTIVSEDLPQIYLWYPANVLVAGPRIGNIHIEPSGSWFFITQLTLKG